MKVDVAIRALDRSGDILDGDEHEVSLRAGARVRIRLAQSQGMLNIETSSNFFGYELVELIDLLTAIAKDWRTK